MDQERIERAISAAGLTFWLKIAEHFPESTGNDIEPETSMALTAAERRAVIEWVSLNVPAENRPLPRHEPGDEPGMLMTYRAFADPNARGAWRVEAIGVNGEHYTTQFSGPEAEARAMEYADFKNGALG